MLCLVVVGPGDGMQISEAHAEEGGASGSHDRDQKATQQRPQEFRPPDWNRNRRTHSDHSSHHEYSAKSGNRSGHRAISIPGRMGVGACFGVEDKGTVVGGPPRGQRSTPGPTNSSGLTDPV